MIERNFLRIYSPVKSIVFSALLFGLMHINPWQAVNAFFGGIFIGWLYWRYRSIWLCMFIHAYYNVIISLLPLPYTRTDSLQYIEEWRHPIWFILLGAALFVIGLLMVIVLSRKERKAEN